MTLNILKNSISGKRERKKEDIKDRFFKKIKINPENGCWEFQGALSRFGHGRIGFRLKIYLTHRLSYEIHNGPIPEGLNVCHKCDNPPCCNPEHLFLGTQNDNVLDAVKKGRMKAYPVMKGERNPASKLKNCQVFQIRKELNAGVKGSELARKYKISKVQISRIKLNKIYKDVTGEASCQ